MKKLHKKYFYCWSVFDEDRNIDFHSYLWVRDSGNVVFDPLPLTAHDRKHLESLGKVSCIVISNSDHVRCAEQLAVELGARVYGPAGERESFPIQCDGWLDESSHVIPDLAIYCLEGSKTSGELAFVADGDTLITGDLIRSHEGGSLCMLPDGKLKDKCQAIESVVRLADIAGINAVLPGDGWPVFRDGHAVLKALKDSIT